MYKLFKIGYWALISIIYLLFTFWQTYSNFYCTCYKAWFFMLKKQIAIEIPWKTFRLPYLYLDCSALVLRGPFLYPIQKGWNKIYNLGFYSFFTILTQERIWIWKNKRNVWSGRNKAGVTQSHNVLLYFAVGLHFYIQRFTYSNENLKIVLLIKKGKPQISEWMVQCWSIRYKCQ